MWCEKAGALILLISEKGNNDYCQFDAGAAWENLAIQGHSMGLVIHPIAMFDHDKARELLAIHENYEILIIIAVGKPGEETQLPPEYQAREFPSSRKKLNEVVSKEEFVW